MIRLLPARPPEPATRTPSRTDRLASRLTEMAHRWLHRRGVPGAIQSMTHTDGHTGRQIDVRVGLYFTTISIDGQDYYFHRLTGRFDGTGSPL